MVVHSTLDGGLFVLGGCVTQHGSGDGAGMGGCDLWETLGVCGIMNVGVILRPRNPFR